MRHYIDLFFLAYFIALHSNYTSLVFLALLDLVKRNGIKMPELDHLVLGDDATPSITLVAPAYNEESTIIQSIRAFTHLEYPNLQLIVVNDGSTDGTMEILKERFQLQPVHANLQYNLKTSPIRRIYISPVEPRLMVIDKENGGKADALNAGLNACRTDLVASLDADTIIDRRAFLRMVEPFLYDDARTVAVGGTVRVANGSRIRDGVVEEVRLPRSWLARLQIVEYMRSFMFGRLGYNRIGGNLIVSGAFGLFRWDAVVKAGGYRKDNVGEDMELIVRLHRYMRASRTRYRIVFIPDAVAFTEVPESIGNLGRQRDRWHRGLAQALWSHRGMFLNPRYGVIGLLVMPSFVLFELLGPVVELAGYGWFIYSLITGNFNPVVVVLFFMVALFWGMLLSFQSVLLDGRMSTIYNSLSIRMKLLGMAVVENFGYRQMLLFFRLRGFFKSFSRNNTWGKIQRYGFQDPRLSPQEIMERQVRQTTLPLSSDETVDPACLPRPAHAASVSAAESASAARGEGL